MIMYLIPVNPNESFGASDSTNYFSEEIEVVAGPGYNVSGVVESILGEHWRPLWITPFKAGVLDLSKFGGGLQAFKRGGGLQTKSIHFKGNDGKRYKFRSMDKDPRQVLPPDLRNTVFADAFKDQISASHPLSSIIVSRLLDEIGVLNAKPIVVVLPDDERLGEFRMEFKRLLGTIEENPTERKNDKPGFANADKIIDTYELYEKLEKDNDNRVDAVEFLKARLLDLMIGDWDRHYDQWLWAGYKDDGLTVYKPIPRDRDQAFSLYDGLLPMIAGRAITQIEGYGKDYPKIYNLSFNGRYLDRRILPMVEKNVYDSLTNFIKEKLTDQVIDEAVSLMPKEWYRLGHKKLKDLITARRNKLDEASEEFFDLINETADIYCSDKNEEIIIHCGEREMSIDVFKIKKDGSRSPVPIYSRVFDPDLTDDIRIYLDKGKDKVTVTGNSFSDGTDISYFPIDVRLVYGEGKKELSDKDLAFIEMTKDSRSKTDMKERFEPANEDRGFDWRFSPVLNYNSDDGIVIGGGPILYHYDYGVKPFDYKLLLTAAYAFGAKSADINFAGEFYSIIKGMKVAPRFHFTQLGITRFYGLGNETPYDKEKDKDGFYNVDQNLAQFSVEFETRLSKRIMMTISPFLRRSNTYDKPGTNLSLYPDIYGIGRIGLTGINGKLTYDSRNNATYPQRGVYIHVLGNFTPGTSEDTQNFGKAGIDFRAYYSYDTTKGVAFAFRGAAGKVWGKYPFYESLFLGGVNSLKGFNRERFAGESVILSQAELRVPVTVINILVPGVIGVSAFGGVGRVFLPDEESKKWHPSFGGSLWISYLNRLYNFELSVGRSYEGFTYSLGTAFFL
jgi:hypothetical protein